VGISLGSDFAFSAAQTASGLQCSMHTRHTLHLNPRARCAHTLHACKYGVQPAAAAAAAAAAIISIEQRRPLIVAVAAVRPCGMTAAAVGRSRCGASPAQRGPATTPYTASCAPQTYLYGAEAKAYFDGHVLLMTHPPASSANGNVSTCWRAGREPAARQVSGFRV
jgi:hypothetical protein